ncbi:TetR/AcrR family transcriptional regulator [Streptomyces sp. NPDC029041]|uniref:TetR/AcrR family transcriptional regulator n=1 Tax=Streptomyces sp. NPDC029041 TaxID=3155727 RepID=UPI0033EC3A86
MSTSVQEHEHGDGSGLRSRLVQVGVDLANSEGAQALSLRELARRAGVSHGAPRRYFATHRELLSAIARQGFEQLGRRAVEVVGDGRAGARDQLLALARGYLDFALSNRGMFELMVRHDLLESNHLGLREASLPLFGVLVELVSRVERPTDAPPEVVAGTLWANLHGIAQLWIWGSLPLVTGAEDIEPLLQAVLDAHLGPAAE